MTSAKSFCRFCHAFCGIDVEIRDGRAIEIRGDRENPMSGGFACIKGRALPEQHNHPDRLTMPLKRKAKGEPFESLAIDRAIDEIAARLADIIDRDQPRSVALYAGTAAYQNAIGLPIARAWMAGIQSPSFYTSLTIDQPSKLVAPQHHGSFASGTQSFASSNVWMVFGCNSPVSMYGGISGFPSFNPSHRLREARRRGLDLIVVDPRRSELARVADLHLQVRPGEDSTLLAGMLRILFEEELEDSEFCARHVNGVETLRAATSDFDLEYVARRCGVSPDLIIEATRRFAKGPRGVASSGTGTSMAPHPNLTEHLIISLNTLCGRYNRAGDEVRNPGTLMPRLFSENVTPPMPGYRMGEQSRIRGLGQIAGELPTAALAEEILLPGPGQVRALIVFGGNPVLAFPDQKKTIDALRQLELLVVLDPFLGATAQMADFVIPPTLCLERSDLTSLMDGWYPEAYAMYTPAAVAPPEGVIEEWMFFWELAQRMGTPLNLAGGALDPSRRPDSDEVLENLSAFSRIPLDEIRRHASGALFPPAQPVFVEAGDPEANARLEVGPEALMLELAEIRRESPVQGGGYRPGENFSHRLISRRLREVCNSVGQELPSLQAKRPYNPAFMNPGDLEALGISSGDRAEIESAHGSIIGTVEGADDIPPGVVSMAHAWGQLPDSPDSRGSSTALLIDTTSDFDPISGIPRMSAIPVNVRPLEPS